MATIIETILSAKDDTGRAFRSAIKSAESFSDTLSDLAGAASQLGANLEKAFELGREAAQFDQTRESFERFLEVVDAAPDLLAQLRDASLGTISDQRLMSATMTLAAGASDDLARNLVANTPALLEIAKAAAVMNPALGDTATLYEDITRGIKRASPMIIDNLGLLVKIGPANEAFAASLGKTVDELTAEERSMALLNATLEAGSNLIRQVGGDVSSAVDPFDTLEASLINTKEALYGVDIAGRTFLEWITDAVDTLNLLLNADATATEILAEHNREMASSTMSYAEYTAEMYRAAAASEVFESNSWGLIGILTKTKVTADMMTETFGFMTAAEREAYQAELQRTAGLEIAAEAQGEFATSLSVTADALAQLEDDQTSLFDTTNTGLQGFVTKWLDTLEFLATGGGELQQAAEDIAAALDAEKITQPEAEGLFREILVGELARQVEAGDSSLRDAARTVRDELNVNYATALQLVKDARAELDAIPDQITTELRVLIRNNTLSMLLSGRPIPVSVPPTAGGYTGVQGHQHGGPMSSGELGVINEDIYGGELFRPNVGGRVQRPGSGRSGGGDGGGLTIVYSPMISTADYDELEDVLGPLVRKWVRAAQ